VLIADFLVDASDKCHPPLLIDVKSAGDCPRTSWPFSTPVALQCLAWF
jgi:hypothetical protein